MESPLEVVDSVAADERENLPQHLKRLFLYCSLFPFDYEFRKLELVQLWIAEGFIRERQWETMEDTASEHFSSLEEKGFLVCSRCDFTTEFDSVLSAPPTEDPGNFLYKVNPNKHSLLEDAISSGNYFKASDGKLDGVSEMQTRHLSLITEDVDAMAFRILQNLKQLRTLHLLSSCASFVKHVPCDLCFTLKFLRTLNLSGTLVSELPSSIGNVKSLRYVDASHTPIARLPESIDSLHNLQTIKLRGCLHFMQLPKGMKKLTKLRHIDLDIIRQLDSLPAHLGNLSDLQTLPAFFVGRDDGCHVTELKNLNGLRGAFTISRLENVSSKEEAEEAALGDKKGIHRLELRWSNLFVEDAVQQEKFLECLQPHFGLEELHIQQYSGSTFPTWISNPSFAYLVGITLYKCRNCKLLPCIGQLPALKSLSLIEVNEVKEINHHFLRTGCSLDHAFPKLERLEVDVMLNLEEWKCVKVGDFPSLVKLIVDSCPKLVTLPALSRLKSLKHLELKRCPKLMSFSSDGLPASLKSLIIVGCLGLKKWLSDHWNMVCHHPSIWFDHEEQKQPKEKLSTPPGAAATTKSEEACSSPAVVKQKQKDQMLYPKPMTVDIPSVNQKIIAAQYQSPNQLGEQVQIWSPKLFKSKPMTVDIPSVNQTIIAAQYQRDLSLSGMFMDPLVNRDEIRIISNREVEIPQLFQAADNQMILADLYVVKVIGQGEGGVVQLVQHKWTGQFFALKVIQMNIQECISRQIAQELKINQCLQCPYIVVCYQSFYDNGCISIILEYMDGGSLTDFLRKVRSIPEPYIAAMCKQVLRGLLYLHHEKYIIHRDFKPSNLLINHRGEIKISDFHVSTIMGSEQANTFVGTYLYMSPERIQGLSYSYKSDIWSLGLVLLECATGKFPYTPPDQSEGWENFFDLMCAVVELPPPCAPSDQFSSEFCSFISACVQKDPKKRLSARDLLEHPFISMYDDLNLDLSSYFTEELGNDLIIRAPAPVLKKQKFGGTAAATTR